MLKQFFKHSAGRIVAIDVVRGVAIIGVMFYHLAWDLRYLRLVDWAVDTNPLWLIYARVLLAAFMLLTGVGLALGHGAGFRPAAFWKRFLLVAGAALAITVSTYWMFPSAFVYFGVLHAIALFSLMAIPFLRLPIWSVLAVALIFIVPPIFYQSAFFNARMTSWLGFWTVPPLTNDLVPVFPWFGFVLLGVIGVRVLRGGAAWQAMSAWQGASGLWGKLTQSLAWAGRWSLFLYLVHQPIVLGILTPLAGMAPADTTYRASDFMGACQQSCLISGEVGFCTRYCSCSLEQIEQGDLWESVQADPPTPKQSRAVSSITQLCSAMAAQLRDKAP